MEKKTIVFDLDDTLVKEIEYLKSAFKEIATLADPENDGLFNVMFDWYKAGKNVFAELTARYSAITIDQLKMMYRYHKPQFDRRSENREILLQLKNDGHYLGLVSDG